MKIGVLSDSHGNRNSLIKALKKMGKVDVIFHLGDFVKDSEHIGNFHQGHIYVVGGNCDCFVNANAPSELEVDIGGKKVFATHGHKYRVKNGLNTLYYKGIEIGADIILFGHTHNSQIIKVDDMVMMNPGSISRPRNAQRSTYGIIEIENGNIKPGIFEF